MIGTGIACSSKHKGDPKAFCAETAKAQLLGGEIQSLSVDSRVTVKAKVHEAAQAADAAASNAPDAIRKPARTLADALDHFDNVVARATDSEDLTAAFARYAATAKGLVAESQAVEKWTRANCPARPSTTTAPPPGASGGNADTGVITNSPATSSSPGTTGRTTTTAHHATPTSRSTNTTARSSTTHP